MMYWFVFQGDALLLRAEAGAKYSIPSGDPPIAELSAVDDMLDITLFDGQRVKAVRMSLAAAVPDGYEKKTLREVYDLLGKERYAMAGKCSELLFWDEHSRFCSVCGTRMETQTAISKRCPVCGNEAWPQLAVAVIVLVYRGNEALMVRAHNFSGNYYGLVAGFVETGESLEEACRREVREETGIEIKDLRYVLSQAWPHPSGLMAGFIAEYDSGLLTLQKEELADGGWYGIDALPPLPHPSGAAYRLIEIFKTKYASSL